MMKNVYSVGYLSDGLRKSELLKRLNDLHENLNILTQEDRPKGLQGTAAQLISKKILYHADKDVRLLASCCLADILRIFAPEV